MVRILLAVAATVLLGLAVSRLDVAAMRVGLLAANGSWLWVAVLVNLLIQPLGALQWRVLLPSSVRTSWRRLLRLFALTSVANNSVNSVVGHATGVALVAAEAGVGTRGALSLLLLDQMCVGVAKLTVLGLAASLLPLPSWMQRGVIGLVCAVAVLAGLVMSSRRWPRLPFVGAITTVPLARLLVAVASALGVKVLEAGGIAAVHMAFGIPCTFTSVTLVLAATTLASLVPVIPANIGAFEAAVFLALRQVGVAAADAMVVAVVLHGCQLLAALAPGAPLVWLPQRRAA